MNKANEKGIKNELANEYKQAMEDKKKKKM